MGVLKKVCLFASAALALLSLVSHFSVRHKENSERARLQQSLSQQIFSPEEIRADIEYFQALLGRVHPPATPSLPLGDPSSAFVNLIETTDAPTTRLEFYKKLAPVGNVLNDEHVMVFPAEQDVQSAYEPNSRLFPLDVEFIDDKLYVVGNHSSESEIEPGMEIKAINGLSADHLRQSVMAYYSGTRRAQKLYYAQKSFREALFLIFGFSGPFDLVVSAADSSGARGYQVSGVKFAKPTVDEFRFENYGPDTILFTYNAFEDRQGQFTEFLEDMFSAAARQGAQHLIIDIRNNQGGASQFGDELLSYLTADRFAQMSHVDVTVSEEVRSEFISYVPAFLRWFPIHYLHPFLRPLWTNELGDTATITFDPVTPDDNPLRYLGNVYLLIGPGTMSSASLFAATLQEMHIATLIGEPAGGYATMYGNIVDIYLPHTGLKVWMPTSVIYGNSSGQIVPDYLVTQTVSDLSNGTDTALQFAMELTRSK